MKHLIIILALLLPGCYVTFDPLTCEWVEETHCYDACWDRPYCESWCDRWGTCTEQCWVEETCQWECAPQYREVCY